MHRVAFSSNQTLTYTNCHIPKNPPCGITEFRGTISTGSPNVFINGKPVARLNDEVDEICSCCGNKKAFLSNGNLKVLVNNRPIIRITDRFTSHEGNLGKIL